MKSPLNQDWLEEVARLKISPSEATQWERALGSRPMEVRRLRQELALNNLLDRVPRPAGSSNFTQRVLAEIEATEARSLRTLSLEWIRTFFSFKFTFPRLALVASVGLALVVGWPQFEFRRPGSLARQFSEISSVAGPVGVVVFQDFDAIRWLDVPDFSGDRELMDALRTD